MSTNIELTIALIATATAVSMACWALWQERRHSTAAGRQAARLDKLQKAAATSASYQQWIWRISEEVAAAEALTRVGTNPSMDLLNVDRWIQLWDMELPLETQPTSSRFLITVTNRMASAAKAPQSDSVKQSFRRAQFAVPPTELAVAG